MLVQVFFTANIFTFIWIFLLQIKEAFDTLSNDKRRLEYDMKTMKRSGDFNRFSTGEYSLYTSKGS